MRLISNCSIAMAACEASFVSPEAMSRRKVSIASNIPCLQRAAI
jgi:hypothetical protein